MLRKDRRPWSALLIVPVLLAVTPTASAEEPRVEKNRTTVDPGEPLLDAPRRGAKALQQLGDLLDVAAARNDLRPAELRGLLRNDSSVWVDQEGLVYYVDPAPESAPAAGAASPANAPLSETFALHSNPGANRTIYLDFDGADVSGTAWNQSNGVSAGAHPGWDPAGDGPAFNDNERQRVQTVWAIVAEDYAPFNVDVTTEDPGTEALVRSSSGDMTYGTRVLVSPSNDAHTKICGGGCGGVAYISVFDSIGTWYQPAWVFPQALGNNPKAVAEAATHEAGHNLGLNHDGDSLNPDYYPGHGVWAPVMGSGYNKPLVQWSQGSYMGANNRQDDVATIAGYLGARSDEAPSSHSAPAVLPVGEAVIGKRDDVDAYLLGSCAAGAAVDVLPAAVAPNLDVRAVLYDASGMVRASHQPPSGYGDGTTASGLGASVTVPEAGNGWVLTVEGVGEGSWYDFENTPGYDDYGSLGAYTVSSSGCDGQQVEGVPSAPSDVAATVGGTSELTLSWTPPTSQGDGPVTGYVVSRSGSATTQTLGVDARSHTFTGLTAGTTYQLSVRAVNGTGAGPTMTVSATTEAPPARAPSAPREVKGSYDQATGKLHAYWTEPLDAGTQPISGYAIYLDGSYLDQIDAMYRGVGITPGSPLAEGPHVVGIAAVSSAGSSPVANVTINVDLPDPPANDGIANAQALPGSTGSVAGDNTYATREATDPAPPGSASGAGGRSVWYAWTPTADGPVTMGTSGGSSNRDTTLAVYTGKPGSLTQVAGNDDSVGLHAAVAFEAVGDTRYLVAVDGFNSTGGTGPFTLSWSHQPPRPPSPPTSVSVQRGDGSAVVAWTPSAPNGSPITGYTVTARAGGQPDRTTAVGGSTTTAVLTGLTNGVTYDVTVTATNALGTSPSSVPLAVTPAGVPNAPAAPSAVRGDRSAVVMWTAAAGNGSPVTGYTVTASPGGQSCSTVGELSCTVEGLENGTSYTFTVSATNAVGRSPGSEASAPVTPAAPTPSATAPGQMARPKVVVSGRKAVVKWAAAEPNGSPITRYLVDISKGKDKSVDGATQKVVFKNLKPGRYKIRVAAQNAVGTSPYSGWVRIRVR